MSAFFEELEVFTRTVEKIFPDFSLNEDCCVEQFRDWHGRTTLKENVEVLPKKREGLLKCAR